MLMAIAFSFIPFIRRLKCRTIDVDMKSVKAFSLSLLINHSKNSLYFYTDSAVIAGGIIGCRCRSSFGCSEMHLL